ncbi:hypothetical protein ABEU95_13040 [Heyndrickxia faecalis]|uniref:hypothetical protein n=1 Tax=Heyndrickxia faecalis TaxID=2824910 RepID=UPI003D220BB0
MVSTFFPFTAAYEKSAAARCSLFGKRDRRHAAPKRPFLTIFAYADFAAMGIFGIIILYFKNDHPFSLHGSGRPIFGIILSRSKNPVAMKKMVSETLRAEKSAERTNKAAIHPIIRESPLLLIKVVIFCS